MKDEHKPQDAENGPEPTPADRRLEELLAQMPTRLCPSRVRENVMAKLREENRRAEAAAESRKPRVVSVWFGRRAKLILQAAAILVFAVVGTKVYFEIKPYLRTEPATSGVTSDHFTSPEKGAVASPAAPSQVKSSPGRPFVPKEKKRDLLQVLPPAPPPRTTPRAGAGSAGELDKLAVAPVVPQKAATTPARATVPERGLEKGKTEAARAILNRWLKTTSRERQAERFPRKAGQRIPAPPVAATRPADRSAPATEPVPSLEAVESKAALRKAGRPEYEHLRRAEQKGGPAEMAVQSQEAPQVVQYGEANRRNNAPVGAVAVEEEFRRRTSIMSKAKRGLSEKVPPAPSNLEWLEIAAPEEKQQRILRRNTVHAIELRQSATESLGMKDEYSTWGVFANNGIAALNDIVQNYGGIVTETQDVVVEPGRRQALMVEARVPAANADELVNTVNQKRMLAVVPQQRRGSITEEGQRAVVTANGAFGSRREPKQAGRPVGLNLKKAREDELAAKHLEAFANFFIQTAPVGQTETAANLERARGRADKRSLGTGVAQYRYKTGAPRLGGTSGRGGFYGALPPRSTATQQTVLPGVQGANAAQRRTDLYTSATGASASTTEMTRLFLLIEPDPLPVEVPSRELMQQLQH